MRRREDFAAVLRHGRRGAASGLVVHVVDSGAAAPARAGFIIGRALGPAVARNRLRRRLRHLLAPVLAARPDGTLIVVRATPAAAQFGRRELVAALDLALDRALPAPRAQSGAASSC